jgi:two-component system sensor histidine kinase KdpD
VAHEFKTPLTSIRAAAGGLTGLVSTGDARELLAIVDEESARLQGLVSDAIWMLHVEAGDFEVRPERHDLRGLVDRVVRDFGTRLAGRTVTNRIPADVQIEADAELLGLALRQLVDNALKYSSPGTVIELDAAMGATADLVVRNSGPAIPSTSATGSSSVSSVVHSPPTVRVGHGAGHRPAHCAGAWRRRDGVERRRRDRVSTVAAACEVTR